MLTINVPKREYFDDSQNKFITIQSAEFELEHSLVSISKWEAKTGKAFLSSEPKTPEEILYYLECMLITERKGLPDNIFITLPETIVKQISDYIHHPMTATKVRQERNKMPSREVLTSEIIYYWMIHHNIPVEFQRWHLNRLLVLINVCIIKSTPPKKLAKDDFLARRSELNAQRKQAHGTSG